MRTSKTILVEIFVVSLLLVSGCKLVGPENEEMPPSTADGLIRVDADIDPETIRKNRFEFVDASLVRRTLSLTVSVSGGCEDHDYQLVTQGALLLSIPPGANLYLIHEDNDDPCDAIIQDTVSFDITPLVESSGFEQIILILWPYDLDQPFEPSLLYDSEAGS
ncbi:MAG: hypothetical protein KJO98_06790 [Rhodothermia bacterium]|nr:hypothetical protein [Rhodothermia bacterium]